jgi:hypothetical protein
VIGHAAAGWDRHRRLSDHAQHDLTRERSHRARMRDRCSMSARVILDVWLIRLPCATYGPRTDARSMSVRDQERCVKWPEPLRCWSRTTRASSWAGSTNRLAVGTRDKARFSSTGSGLPRVRRRRSPNRVHDHRADGHRARHPVRGEAPVSVGPHHALLAEAITGTAGPETRQRSRASMIRRDPFDEQGSCASASSPLGQPAFTPRRQLYRQGVIRVRTP